MEGMVDRMDRIVVAEDQVGENRRNGKWEELKKRKG